MKCQISPDAYDIYIHTFGLVSFSGYRALVFSFCCRESSLFLTINPRPAGVWLVTRPAGGGGQRSPPPEISQTTGPISKFQTPFDSPVRELPVQGQKFDPEVTDDVIGSGQSQNFRLFGLGDIGEYNFDVNRKESQ